MFTSVRIWSSTRGLFKAAVNASWPTRFSAYVRAKSSIGGRSGSKSQSENSSNFSDWAIKTAKAIFAYSQAFAWAGGVRLTAALQFASLTSAASGGEVEQRSGEAVVFQGLQASVNLCDQEALPLLQDVRARGVGTIAKRSLAGRPWQGVYTGDAVHDEYRRRFEALRPALALEIDDWDAFALRFAAFAPGVDCVIVGGTDVANVDRNVATVRRGPLKLEQRLAVGKAWEARGRHWEGLV